MEARISTVPTTLIRDLPLGTASMLEQFGDAAHIRAALAFEAALAEACGALGLVPRHHAALIAETARRLAPDPAALAAQAAHAGTLAIPLVKLLRAAVAGADPAAAQHVHRGATSQDLADTALVLQARAGTALLMTDFGRIDRALARHARRLAGTPALGRTLLQPARPITFGLRVAQWRRAQKDAAARLESEAARALTLQLGGAAGTLDGFAGQSRAVAEGVAERLGLPPSALPWHARRGNLAGLGAACAIVCGEAAKMARDIALLAQPEIGEAREPSAPGRGGSSAMPHKQNPTLCQVALTAAVRAPGLAATLFAGLPGEHERGLGGWQGEGKTLADLFSAAGAASAAMAEAAEGLETDEGAMLRNLDSADVGRDTGEAASMALRSLDEV